MGGHPLVTCFLQSARAPLGEPPHSMSSVWSVVSLLKSNQIKSLLLSHHHSTSALVSEILMSVLQTVQKNNNKQFTYGQTVQKNKNKIKIKIKKLHWSIYSAPDSAKKTTTIYIWTDSAKKKKKILHMDRQCKKTALEHLQCSRQCKKNNNNNLHMDSTYLQTLQKTMCKIHIHILSTHSVL